MKGHDFSVLVERELHRLAGGIEAYDDEAEVWRTHAGQNNSPGTLALHLCGNLHHYIGAVLGENGYVRDRPAEFRDHVSRAELLERIEHCRGVVTGVLDELTSEGIEAVYPGEVPAHMTGIRTGPYLMHTIWHMGWHLGQIYYHRLGGGVAGST